MLALDKNIFRKELADKIDFRQVSRQFDGISVGNLDPESGDIISFSIKNENVKDYVCIINERFYSKYPSPFKKVNPFYNIIYDSKGTDITYYLFLDILDPNYGTRESEEYARQLGQVLLSDLFLTEKGKIKDKSRFAEVNYDLTKEEYKTGYIVIEFKIENKKLSLKETDDSKPIANFQKDGSIDLARYFFEKVIPDFEKRILKLVEQSDAPQPQPIITTGIEDDGIKTTLETEAENEGQETTGMDDFGDEPEPPPPPQPQPPKEFIKPEEGDIIRIGSDQFAIVESLKEGRFNNDELINIRNISKEEAMNILKQRKEEMDNLSSQME